jgi:MraZ protein
MDTEFTGFTGEYYHTVDTKGRLIVPADFREQLGDAFVVTKGLDGCLFAYEQNEWKELEAKIRKLPLTSAGARKFTRHMLGGARVCEVDKLGRVLLSQPLRTFAELEKDVVWVGTGGRIEIWDKVKYDAVTTIDDADELAESMEGLAI